jgi:hypothetical protein
MEMSLKIDSIKINGANRSMLLIEMEGVDTEEVLDNFSLSEIINHYGAKELLEGIGKDAAVNHWDLKENE